MKGEAKVSWDSGASWRCLRIRSVGGKGLRIKHRSAYYIVYKRLRHHYYECACARLVQVVEKSDFDMSLVVSVSSEVMSGTPVFSGTRVPVETFFDYLKAGDSIDDFLDGFPSVSKVQVIALLEEISKQFTSAVA